MEKAGYGVIVIGGGPAGVTAALRARELDATVALVERGRMGGTCTNDGCVPVRVLAKAARLARDARQAREYGLVGEPPAVDFTAVMERVRHVVGRVHEKKRLVEHLREAGVDVFSGVGDAAFADPHTLRLPDGRTLRGDKFIVCAGGRPRRLPCPGGEVALTVSEFWDVRTPPRRVAVVGAAATGCQLASVLNAFGSKVTLLETAPRILSVEDEDVSRTIDASFRARGIEILAGVESVERIDSAAGDGARRVHYRRGGTAASLDADLVVVSIGWPGNADRLNVAAAGVEADPKKGYLRIDDCQRTTAPHVFAAGDVDGRMMLVQSAVSDGVVAAENAVLGTGRCCELHIVPSGGFTDPEYGSVGLTERKARDAHPDCVAALVPYAELDRAVIDGHTEGFCKLIADRHTRLVLGAHVVGENAVEVVQIVAAGMTAGVRVEQLADLQLAYPTYTAIVGLTARQIVRELGLIPLARPWHDLKCPAEWEQGRTGKTPLT